MSLVSAFIAAKYQSHEQDDGSRRIEIGVVLTPGETALLFDLIARQADRADYALVSGEAIGGPVRF